MARSTCFVRAAAALGVVAVSLGLLAAPAGAGASGATQNQQPARTFLMLGVSPQEAPATVAMLTCEPPGGTHPEATAACRDLNQAGGDFTKLPGSPSEAICPDIWQPVTATAFGMWKGRLTWYVHQYSNPCELRAATGPVFVMRITRITEPPAAEPTTGTN